VISFFVLSVWPQTLNAGAPIRAVPYVESICNTDSNVFFCEDFEGRDINNFGSNNCNSTWGNPAIANKDICWAGGGSYQLATVPLSGFASTNRVWRVSKSQGFTDILTGRNTGTGGGTLAGWLRSDILGTGAQEWYTRIQVYFHTDHTWPADYDFKMFFALPRTFVDPPSAAYEAGMYFHQDFWCSSGGNFNDVPVIRYSSNFRQFPYQNQYCPPLAVGVDPNGTQAPRFQKGRWYTLEYHVKLSSGSSGVLEMWVDGKRAYQYNGVTCHNGCPDMGYVMIMGWMNSADRQTGYYEIDNVVMSRSYIGPPYEITTPPNVTQVPVSPSNLIIQ
jgi:hypothetical protein